MLKPGEPAPAFELPDADMSMVGLGGFKGSRNVVLYFYPRDDTPGCTMEAVDFSDFEDAFLGLDAVVMGISMDDCISHAAFRDKHGISVALLADTEGEVCGRYGVLQQGQEGGGARRRILRSTFVIDKSGVVRHALYGVNARGHAADVLDLVKELN